MLGIIINLPFVPAGIGFCGIFPFPPLPTLVFLPGVI